jgi:hypoxanthine-guanine phosphoribosyltransferase
MLEAKGAEILLSFVAEQLVSHVRSKFTNNILLVAFSVPMHKICVAAAGILKSQSEHLEVNVVGVKNSDEPVLLCKPRVFNEKKVVLVTDIVRNGNLLESLWKIAAANEPARISAFTLISQDYEGKHADALHAVARQPKSSREVAIRSGSDFSGLRYFDPASGKSRQEKPCKEPMPWCLGNVEALLPLLIQTRALKRNHKIGNSVYPYSIDVAALLENQPARKKLTSMAREFCKTLDRDKKWVFVFPVSRTNRAGRVAELLSEVSGYANISLGNLGDSCFFDLTHDEKKFLEDYDGIVVVDAAIRSGATLRSQLEVLSRLEGKTTKSFYALDLRRPRDRDAHSNEFKIDINSLFEVPLGFAPATVRTLLETRFEPLSTTIHATPYCDSTKKLLAGFYRRISRTRRIGSPRKIASDKVKEEIYKGTRKPSEVLEEVAAGNLINFSLTGFLAGDAKLLSESQRRHIAYMIHNAESPRVLRELALTMTSYGEYGWFTKDWLLLHECLFNKESNWDFLPAIAYDAVQRNPIAVSHMLAVLREYEGVVIDRSRSQYLFECSPTESKVREICGVLKEILATSCDSRELLVSF